MTLPDSNAIRALAESLVGSPCHFIKTVGDPLFGGEYFVYPLESASKHRLCVRIPKDTTNPHTSLLVEREADIRHRITVARIDLFQPLLRFDSKADNPLHTPFMALGWADGTSLKWSDTCPASDWERKQVIQAVANASLDLLRVQKPGSSALAWVSSKIDRKIVRAQAEKLPGGTVDECHHQMRLTEEYWIPKLDAAPHVLVHGDLSSNNVIVDEQHCVQGIIDLGWAEFVPLQFAAVYPRFLTHEPSHHNGFDWTERNTERMEQDRACYLECVERRALRDGGIMLDYYQVLSRQDEIKRYWWLSATSRIDIHRAMSACNWTPTIQTHQMY